MEFDHQSFCTNYLFTRKQIDVLAFTRENITYLVKNSFNSALKTPSPTNFRFFEIVVAIFKHREQQKGKCGRELPTNDKSDGTQNEIGINDSWSWDVKFTSCCALFYRSVVLLS